MTRLLYMFLLVGAVAEAASAQTAVGVLPFADESGAGSSFAGTSIGRSMSSELRKTAGLIIRSLDAPAARADDDAGERAVAIGRELKLDRVLVGTVVEAESEESTKSGWLPRIQGQQVNLRLRSVKATVKLRGELFDVASGTRIAIVQSEGKSSDNKFAGTIWSTMGSWDAGNDAAFRGSPLGKAVQDGVEELAKKLTPALSRR
jgi:hypothetical protein